MPSSTPEGRPPIIPPMQLCIHARSFFCASAFAATSVVNRAQLDAPLLFVHARVNRLGGLLRLKRRSDRLSVDVVVFEAQGRRKPVRDFSTSNSCRS